MKVKCITTSYYPYNKKSEVMSNGVIAHYQCLELSDYITVDKIYETLPNPLSQWVFKIIDDRGLEHDIGKECFIPIRDINLDKLLD